MVSKRLAVNVPRVNYYDGQNVTKDELQTDQDRHVDIDAADVLNFLGSGIVKNAPLPSVILDTNSLNPQQQTLIDGYSFDGQNVYTGTPLTTVTDTTEGVLLAVTLQNVQLDGAASTRVVIIGDEFGGGLIHDELTFHANGTKIVRGRYKTIRAILFNDFAGNLYGSNSYAMDGYSLIGRCIVQEISSMEVSPDHIVVSQTGQPNRFFYNFHPATYSTTVAEMLQDAIGPDKSVSDLNIAFDSKDQRELVADDVTTRIGQKFKATGSNIQKISVLLSTKYNILDGYDWSGSIVMNLHALQTEVDCPVSPVPDNTIDFDPDPAIIAQLSLDKNDLEKQGIVLDGYPKIVDFVFTGSKISDPVRSPIEEDRYYIFTLNRSGDAHTGIILIEEADDRTDFSYMAYYNGVQWTNITDSDMWFSIEGDYVKIADGIAYEDGVGVEIPKIQKDATNTEVPYVEGFLSFYTSSYDAYNYVLIEQGNSYSESVQDQRTGDPVYTRITPSATISLISQSGLTTLLTTDPAPLLLARAKDTNPRGNPATISGTSGNIGLTVGNEFNILRPDADIRNFNLVNSLLTPNTAATYSYRIIKATLYNDAYGDVNGDGNIDTTDLLLALDIASKTYDGYNYHRLSDAYVQQKIIDGYIDVLQFLRADVNGDGYVDPVDTGLINQYINKVVLTFPAGSTFSRMNLLTESVLNPLTTTINISGADSVFTTVPFVSVPWEIDYFATWFADYLKIEDLRRFMFTTFVEPSSTAKPGGSNTTYIPGDIIIDGYQKNDDGTFYSVDFEMTHISLTMPVTDSYGNPIFYDGYDAYDGYSGILLFDNFVAESSNGLTASGFPALKYADGTYAQLADFASGKIKISPSIQSEASTFVTPFGATINDIVGLYYDPSTSLMMLYLDNPYDGYNILLPSVSTKVLVSVYLKKAGFRNPTMEVTQSQMLELLGI